MNEFQRFSKMRKICFATSLAVSSFFLTACVGIATPETVETSQEWQDEFNLSARKLGPTGENDYFILTPGFQMTLESQTEILVISVLEETREINGITTRIVEEREQKNGELAEISRNYYAIDSETGDVFYFGEEVDFYSQGEISGHSGAWIAYEDENKPGLIMPGKLEVGMKYYQEKAPGVATDRARVVSVTETFATTVGDFARCLLTQESSQLSPTTIEYKTYCPGIGLVQDQSLLLTSYGYQ